MQSLFFPCMKERDKRGSARRVPSRYLDLLVDLYEPSVFVEIALSLVEL